MPRIGRAMPVTPLIAKLAVTVAVVVTRRIFRTNI